jgi:CDP-glycerol glycerophosphotransferase (TagB/SpsB family)
MRRLLQGVLEFLHRISPRWNHAVLWGWPDGEDSMIALEEALQDATVNRVVLLVSDPQRGPSWRTGPKTIRLRKNSVAGCFWFCLAKHVFFSHPCFTRRFPADVVSVNVWHGMPIKKIGLLLDGDEGISSRFALATSPFWAEIMQRAMAPHGRVLPLGLPRNDRLFAGRAPFFAKAGLPGFRKLVVWLPTYRKSARGLPRADGIDAGNVFEMPDADPEKLNGFLASRDTLLLVKPHPMAAHQAVGGLSHLMIVDDAWLASRRVSLYQMLGAADVLVSDVSSAVIDFLLLDRPVIHAFADLDAYRQSRGFTVEPVERLFAGPVVTTQEELVEVLCGALAGDDPCADQRRDLMKLSHTHNDAGSTHRLLGELGLRKS